MKETSDMRAAFADLPWQEDQLHWYAAYTYPRHEKAVAERLQLLSVEVFLPLLTAVNRWKDRHVSIHSPLFPGYLFTRIQAGQRSRVLDVPGVVRILSSNGTPAPLSDAEIEAVRFCLQRGATLKACSAPGVGDRVRVRSGPLAGLEGVISRSKNERRLLVPISMINQSVSVDVDVQLLEPIGAVTASPCGTGIASHALAQRAV